MNHYTPEMHKEMRKYRAIHAGRNFSNAGIGYGTITAIVLVMSFCLWLVS